jgi:hypothetical protein
MVSVNENMNEEDSSSNMTSKSSSTVTSAGPIGKKDTNLVINDEEAELYDRQIRLWGLDAQNRYMICCSNDQLYVAIISD